MRLVGFEVKDFRSVEESGWVEVDPVTALIGVNESGKTNLLLPLWKLKPAQDGEIQPTSDYPKKKFGEIRAAPSDFWFITAEFLLEADDNQILELANLSLVNAPRARVWRYFDGNYGVSIKQNVGEEIPLSCRLRLLLSEASVEIASLRALKQEEAIQRSFAAIVDGFPITENSVDDVKPAGLVLVRSEIAASLPETPAKTSVIVPRVQRVLDELDEMHAQATRPDPGCDPQVLQAIISALPTFVYYSNYGNLDSEIYLPHVVDNLKRGDLGSKEAAKVRTLRVLFDFVRLLPGEILELGRDFTDLRRAPTSEEIESIARKKRERSILLQSAGALLTEKFREWWKQGDYRFRFEADGDHFRIWVSDDRRPTEVELENRSTGLQWFLSFYLVFLVESLGIYKKAVLLLDEPGLSLHPLAQRDLSAFFQNLSESNVIVYTTHSPFLVDADRLERARKVYVETDGTTKITANLRLGENATQVGASYAVHSALNLSVAESLLLGCQPVVVEGASDQHYLTTIKSLLIGAKRFAPKRELVFPPSGGTKTARVVASILTGRNEELPMLLLDGDEAGIRMARELRSSLYSDQPDRVHCVDDYTQIRNSEIEDLFPTKIFAGIVDRWERRPDTPFSDLVKDGAPIVPQIEQWARANALTLENGWKVALAKTVKGALLAKGVVDFEEDTLNVWTKLFEALSHG